MERGRAHSDTLDSPYSRGQFGGGSVANLPPLSFLFRPVASFGMQPFALHYPRGSSPNDTARGRSRVPGPVRRFVAAPVTLEIESQLCQYWIVPSLATAKGLETFLRSKERVPAIVPVLRFERHENHSSFDLFERLYDDCLVRPPEISKGPAPRCNRCELANRIRRILFSSPGESYRVW